MMGLVLHTENGFEAGTIATFNNTASQASAFFSVGLDGVIHQYGPIGFDWMAWAQEDGNPMWYSVENADNHPGAPPITEPLSPEQVMAVAQLFEVLSRFAGFPLQITDSVDNKGLGVHAMGGVPWGDHPYCPGAVRTGQRPEIVALAHEIRAGTAPPPPAELEGIVVLAARRHVTESPVEGRRQDVAIDVAVTGCPHCDLLVAMFVEINQKLESIMSEQSQVDADVTALEACITAIGTAVTAIAAEIASLQAANPQLDLTGLNQAVTDLQNATTAVEGLETPPAPAPAG